MFRIIGYYIIRSLVPQILGMGVRFIDNRLSQTDIFLVYITLVCTHYIRYKGTDQQKTWPQGVAVGALLSLKHRGHLLCT